MFIQTENTPNPATLKFLPGRAVLGDGGAEFTSAEAAEASPLAQRLFAIPDVSGVYLGADFVTVTKSDGDWRHLKPPILAAIMDHFMSGAPVITSDAADDVAPDAGVYAEEDAEIVAQIKDLLDSRVRPAVAMDGGDITFHGFERGVVYLRMMGACSGCPSSTATLKHGVENMLRHYVPEVMEVRAV